jgi:membrane-associated phospholipid phosphatase
MEGTIREGPPEPFDRLVQIQEAGVYQADLKGTAVAAPPLVEQRDGPFTAGTWNRTAADLIQSHHRKETEVARILAYANAAAFDAQIDCFTTKFAYWARRPTQADARIEALRAIPLPNHPSYPSAHSCISSALAAVLADAFPSERRGLDALVEEAGLLRIYAGIHDRFDVEAGQDIGRRAAAKALAGSLE